MLCAPLCRALNNKNNNMHGATTDGAARAIDGGTLFDFVENNISARPSRTEFSFSLSVSSTRIDTHYVTHDCVDDDSITLRFCKRYSFDEILFCGGCVDVPVYLKT